VQINTMPSTGQLASTLPDQDCSTSTFDYDGLFVQAAKTGVAYWKTQPTGPAGVGTSLTSDGAGGIVELEEAFTTFYNLYRLSPTTIMVSAQECQNITQKVISNGGAPLIRWVQDANSLAGGKIIAGMSIGGYLNKIMGVEVPIVVHPNLAPGTIFLYSSTIPYPLPGTAHVIRKRLRQEVYQLEWPLKDRRWEYGVYADGVLQHFAPFSMGAITNIANG
jgi:hypothetical protein